MIDVNSRHLNFHLYCVGDEGNLKLLMFAPEQNGQAKPFDSPLTVLSEHEDVVAPYPRPQYVQATPDAHYPSKYSRPIVVELGCSAHTVPKLVLV